MIQQTEQYLIEFIKVRLDVITCVIRDVETEKWLKNSMRWSGERRRNISVLLLLAVLIGSDFNKATTLKAKTKA